MKQKFKIIREPVIRVPGGENFTPGVMYLDNVRFCVTCEDEDRFLENGVVQKVYGKTAIPRGTYRLGMRFSPHFGRNMPWIMDVPNYEYVMLHGANRAEDLLGCVGVGKVRTQTGIAQCADTVQRIINIIETGEETVIESWLEIE